MPASQSPNPATRIMSWSDEPVISSDVTTLEDAWLSAGVGWVLLGLFCSFVGWMSFGWAGLSPLVLVFVGGSSLIDWTVVQIGRLAVRGLSLRVEANCVRIGEKTRAIVVVDPRSEVVVKRVRARVVTREWCATAKVFGSLTGQKKMFTRTPWIHLPPSAPLASRTKLSVELEVPDTFTASWRTELQSITHLVIVDVKIGAWPSVRLCAPLTILPEVA